MEKPGRTRPPGPVVLPSECQQPMEAKMARTVEQMQQSLELILNEIGADQTVNRVVLQTLLIDLMAVKGPEILEDMKQQVLGIIGRTEPTATDPQGGERRKQLTLMRAESMFQEIEEAVGGAVKGLGPSASN